MIQEELHCERRVHEQESCPERPGHEALFAPRFPSARLRQRKPFGVPQVVLCCHEEVGPECSWKKRVAKEKEFGRACSQPWPKRQALCACRHGRAAPRVCWGLEGGDDFASPHPQPGDSGPAARPVPSFSQAEKITGNLGFPAPWCLVYHAGQSQSREGFLAHNWNQILKRMIDLEKMKCRQEHY